MHEFTMDTALYHKAVSRTALSIRGTFFLQGPARIGPHAIPEEIGVIFAKYPTVHQVAFNGDTHGEVYTRMRPEAELPPEPKSKFPLNEAIALMRAGGIEYSAYWELLNPYWRDNETMGPRWMFKTRRGLIMLHWRKNVLEIDWSDTDVRIEVTRDDVTKSETMVHAWSLQKADEYIAGLGIAFRNQPRK